MRETMELLDRVIFHLTSRRRQAAKRNDVDEWEELDQCVWIMRKWREAKSFEL